MATRNIVKADTSIECTGTTVTLRPLLYYGSITNLSWSAGGTATATFTNFFTNTNVSRGEIRLFAFSHLLGTAKYYLGGYQARTLNTTHVVGTAAGLASCELGNSNTGGSNITAARSNADLVFTVDFTDGASVAGVDGEVHLYLSQLVN